MTIFKEKLNEIKTNLNYEFKDRSWEMEHYLKDAITYANTFKNLNLNEKMTIIDEFTREQLEITTPKWMY